MSLPQQMIGMCRGTVANPNPTKSLQHLSLLADYANAKTEEGARSKWEAAQAVAVGYSLLTDPKGTFYDGYDLSAPSVFFNRREEILAAARTGFSRTLIGQSWHLEGKFVKANLPHFKKMREYAELGVISTNAADVILESAVACLRNCDLRWYRKSLSSDLNALVGFLDQDAEITERAVDAVVFSFEHLGLSRDEVKNMAASGNRDQLLETYPAIGREMRNRLRHFLIQMYDQRKERFRMNDAANRFGITPKLVERAMTLGIVSPLHANEVDTHHAWQEWGSALRIAGYGALFGGLFGMGNSAVISGLLYELGSKETSTIMKAALAMDAAFFFMYIMITGIIVLGGTLFLHTDLVSNSARQRIKADLPLE